MCGSGITAPQIFLPKGRGHLALNPHISGIVNLISMELVLLERKESNPVRLENGKTS